MEQRQRVEDPILVLNVGDEQALPNVREQIAVRELDAFGHSFGTAGEKDHRGVGRLQAVVGGSPVERAPEQREKSVRAGDVLAHLLKVSQFHAGLDERVHIEFGTFQEGPRRNDSFHTGQVHAREHRARSG